MGLIPLGFWAASGAGGGGAAADYELISTTVLGSSAASVTFSGLGTSAAAYKHLQLRMTARTDYASANLGEANIQFNGDTGSNYAWHSLLGTGSTVASQNGTSQTSARFSNIPYGSSTASMFSAGVVDILDFNSTSKNKTLRALNGVANSSDWRVSLFSGAWFSTSAITSFTITPNIANFVTGSRFSLYGLK